MNWARWRSANGMWRIQSAIALSLLVWASSGASQETLARAAQDEGDGGREGRGAALNAVEGMEQHRRLQQMATTGPLVSLVVAQDPYVTARLFDAAHGDMGVSTAMMQAGVYSTFFQDGAPLSGALLPNSSLESISCMTWPRTALGGVCEFRVSSSRLPTLPQTLYKGTPGMFTNGGLLCMSNITWQISGTPPEQTFSCMPSTNTSTAVYYGARYLCCLFRPNMPDPPNPPVSPSPPPSRPPMPSGTGRPYIPQFPSFANRPFAPRWPNLPPPSPADTQPPSPPPTPPYRPRTPTFPPFIPDFPPERTQPMFPVVGPTIRPPAPPPPIPPRPPAPEPPSPSPVRTYTDSCGPSWLDYRCTRPVGDVQLHWSWGEEAPTNLCTGTHIAVNSSAAMLANSTDSNTTWVHYAVEARSQAAGSGPPGYVAWAFAQTAGVMAPALAVFGVAEAFSGLSRVEVQLLEGHQQGVTGPDLQAAISQAGVAHRGDNTTILCFSMQLQPPAAGQPEQLQQQQQQGTRRLLLTSQQLSWLPSAIDSDSQFNWAVGPPSRPADSAWWSGQPLPQHVSAGGVTLKLMTGEVEAAPSQPWVALLVAHACCLATAFLVFFPLAGMTARHRHVFFQLPTDPDSYQQQRRTPTPPVQPWTPNLGATEEQQGQDDDDGTLITTQPAPPTPRAPSHHTNDGHMFKGSSGTLGAPSSPIQILGSASSAPVAVAPAPLAHSDSKRLRTSVPVMESTNRTGATGSSDTMQRNSPRRRHGIVPVSGATIRFAGPVAEGTLQHESPRRHNNDVGEHTRGGVVPVVDAARTGGVPVAEATRALSGARTSSSTDRPSLIAQPSLRNAERTSLHSQTSYRNSDRPSLLSHNSSRTSRSTPAMIAEINLQGTSWQEPWAKKSARLAGEGPETVAETPAAPAETSSAPPHEWRADCGPYRVSGMPKWMKVHVAMNVLGFAMFVVALALGCVWAGKHPDSKASRGFVAVDVAAGFVVLVLLILQAVSPLYGLHRPVPAHVLRPNTHQILGRVVVVAGWVYLALTAVLLVSMPLQHSVHWVWGILAGMIIIIVAADVYLRTRKGSPRRASWAAAALRWTENPYSDNFHDVMAVQGGEDKQEGDPSDQDAPGGLQSTSVIRVNRGPMSSLGGDSLGGQGGGGSGSPGANQAGMRGTLAGPVAWMGVVGRGGSGAGPSGVGGAGAGAMAAGVMGMVAGSSGGGSGAVGGRDLGGVGGESVRLSPHLDFRVMTDADPLDIKLVSPSTSKPAPAPISVLPTDEDVLVEEPAYSTANRLSANAIARSSSHRDAATLPPAVKQGQLPPLLLPAGRKPVPLRMLPPVVAAVAAAYGATEDERASPRGPGPLLDANSPRVGVREAFVDAPSPPVGLQRGGSLSPASSAASSPFRASVGPRMRSTSMGAVGPSGGPSQGDDSPVSPTMRSLRDRNSLPRAWGAADDGGGGGRGGGSPGGQAWMMHAAGPGLWAGTGSEAGAGAEQSSAPLSSSPGLATTFLKRSVSKAQPPPTTLDSGHAALAPSPSRGSGGQSMLSRAMSIGAALTGNWTSGAKTPVQEPVPSQPSGGPTRLPPLTDWGITNEISEASDS